MGELGNEIVYGVVPAAQQESIDRFCMKCGKLIVAGIIDDIVGPILPCRTKECPFEEKAPILYGEIAFEDITYDLWLRKLQAVN